MNHRKGNIGGRGFTLTELIVVITLLAIVVAIGLPAFGSMLSASNRSLAVGQFRAAMSSARDAAVRSTDSDSAAVFFFEPGGRLTIATYIQVGTMEDRDPQYTGNFPQVSVKRDVFAPAAAVQVMQMPPGWMVRGFAPSSMLDDNANQTGWYPNSALRDYNRETGAWVFPETGFYDPEADSDAAGRVSYRQTFMVRFEKGTGNLVVNQTIPAVVVSPRPGASGAITRQAGAPEQTNWRRVDRAQDLSQWTKRLTRRRVVPNGAAAGEVSSTDLAGLIGAESGDTVLANSVDLVSLYDEKSLSGALGARGLNRASGSIYRWTDGSTPRPTEPEIDAQLFNSASPRQIGQQIDEWLVGKLQQNGRYVESDALIYGFDRHSGEPREVKP